MGTRCLIASLILLVASPSARAAIEEQRTSEPARPAKAPVLTRAPALLESVPAVYPAELVEQKLAGEANLQVDIDAEGAVDRLQVLSATHPAFGMAAMEAVSHFRFSPALVDDMPSGIRIEYRTHFAPAVPQPVPAADPNATSQGEAPIVLQGLVREAGIRAPVAHAGVAINGNFVAETNADGAFTVRARSNLPPGTLTVAITHPDFQAYQVVESREANQRLEAKYYLVRSHGSAYETVVRSKADRHEVAKIELTREELMTVPGTFGDPIRVLQNLPGMGRAPSLSGALIVRGANPQDTQVLVDGMPVPILYHLFGLTSVINAEFLDRIDFFPGGFGARYGRATAGVVDIVTRDLTCDLWHGVGKAAVMDGSLYTCVPLGEWRVAAAGRRSFIDFILPAVLKAAEHPNGQGYITASPSYWDYQVLARTTLPGHVIRLGAFGSNDYLDVIQGGSLANVALNIGLIQGFHRLTGVDRWRINDSITLTSTLSLAYQYQTFQAEVTEAGVSDNLQDDAYGIDWREDLTMQLLPNLKLNAGIDHTFGFAGVSFKVPSQDQLDTFPSPTTDYSTSDQYSNHPGNILQGYWAELIYDPLPNLRLVPGLRLDQFHFAETNVFLAEPRATVRWEFLPGSTAKAAYGLYGRLPDPQYLLPKYGNPSLTAERSQQFVVGYEQQWPWLVYTDLQAYYNMRYDLTAPSSSISIAQGAVQPQVWANSGVGQTYGLELLLRRLPSPDTNFYGWVSYTLSRSLRRDHPLGSTYNSGTQNVPYSDYSTQQYLSPFDQTHILTVVAQWLLPQGWEAGFRFRLVSGDPVTPQQRGRIFVDNDEDAYVDDMAQVARNSDRYPLFQELDIRVDKKFVFDLWKLTIFLEVLNVYDAHNVEVYQYDYRYRTRVPVTLLPIIPNLGINGEF